MTNQNVMVKTYLKKSIYITNLEERKKNTGKIYNNKKKEKFTII